MKKILTQARVTEVGDVTSRLVSLYKSAESIKTDEFLKQNFTELENLGDTLKEAVKRDVVVSKLDEADTKRNNAIRVLDRVLKGYESIPVENLRKHGEKLYAVFAKYGVKIISENYSSQSTLTNSLLQDFSASELEESISALSGVTEAIEDVRTTQRNFAKVREDYDKALSKQENSVSASSLRKPVQDLINKKIIPYLVAMEIAQPDTYKTFVDEASQIIESVNETIKSRSKSKNKEVKESKKEAQDNIN